MSARPSKSAFRPQLENLEDRRVMSASIVAGNLVINQSNGNDTAVVTQFQRPVGVLQAAAPAIGTTSTALLTRFPHVFSVNMIKVQETINGVVQTPKTFFASSVTGRIVYNGFAGNDVFDNQTSIKSTAFGGAGNDKLLGGHNDDILCGGTGNDELHGREGNDWLYGDAGNDVIRAGQGNDHLYGGTGYDDLFGAFGNDYLDGGHDGIADKLTGGTGADTFVAEPVHIIFFTFNRDKPTDFNAAEGDHIL